MGKKNERQMPGKTEMRQKKKGLKKVGKRPAGREEWGQLIRMMKKGQIITIGLCHSCAVMVHIPKVHYPDLAAVLVRDAENAHPSPISGCAKTVSLANNRDSHAIV